MRFKSDYVITKRENGKLKEENKKLRTALIGLRFAAKVIKGHEPIHPKTIIEIVDDALDIDCDAKGGK